ncbi:MAG TPA: VPLPA-CTERM sorting domain-containing protein [Pseudolabrys sp.]|nr:VPLPA-CTERM sorting domain-containing protein [Pseudolabrys sp.]
MKYFFIMVLKNMRCLALVGNIALTMFIAVPSTVSAAYIGATVEEHVFGVDSNGNSYLADSCNVDFQIPSAFCAGSGYGSAYANMNTGTMTAHYSVPQDSLMGIGGGGASTFIYDFLKFSGYSSGQHVVITATGSAASTLPNGFADLGLDLSFSQDPSAPNNNSFDIDTFNVVSGCTNPSSFPDVTVCRNNNGGSLGVSIDFPINYVNPANGVYLRAFLDCTDHSATGGGTCDATDPITITLPAGVTFTSASGQFLTAVPVPAAGWLFGSGLLGLVGVARRRGA